MRREDILSLTRAQPFVPFQLTLTNGDVYDVTDPGLVEVPESVVRLYQRAPETPTGPALRVMISLLHVTAAEAAEQDYPMVVTNPEVHG